MKNSAKKISMNHFILRNVKLVKKNKYEMFFPKNEKLVLEFTYNTFYF